MLHCQTNEVNIGQMLGIRERWKEVTCKKRNIVGPELVTAIASPGGKKFTNQFRRTDPSLGCWATEDSQDTIFGQWACCPTIRSLICKKVRRLYVVKMALIHQSNQDIHIKKRCHFPKEPRIAF